MNDRTPRQAEIINFALDLFRAGLYVGRPCRVDSVDNDNETVDVVPMLQDNYTDDSDDVIDYQLPIIPALPILFMEGGDFVDTFPIAKGDQGWILFADRSIDQWQQLGNAGDPVLPLTEMRHSVPAKGLFLPGGRSVKEAITEWDPARRVIGKQGGKRIAFTDSKIHLGVDHKEDASDAIALASKTKSELDDLRTAFNDFVQNTYNNHTHFVSTAGPPLAHTGTTEPTTMIGTGKTSPTGDVKSEIVLAE